MAQHVLHAFLYISLPSLHDLVCYTAVFRVVTHRSSSLPLGEALRDDTKNGCVADYARLRRENA